jgi:hypothetical protein
LRRAFDGSATSLLQGALTAKPASPEELAKIHEMIAEYSKNSANKKGRAR